MLSGKKKSILQLLCLIVTLYITLPPLFKTWNWGQDHSNLFDLSTQFQKNNTDFYSWLGVQSNANVAEISKAHRQLALTLHPESPTANKEKFEITNQVAYILRTPKLRALYDKILYQGHLPYFKGVYYYYTRHKLVCMSILSVIALICMEYLKAWEKYFNDKLAFDQFIVNAKSMAQKLSDKHAGAKTHKNWIDLGDRVIRCEITKEKDIFLLNEKGERIPLNSQNGVPMPSILDTTLFRLVYNLIEKLLIKTR